MSYSQRLLQQGTSITRLAHQSRFRQVIQAIGKQQYKCVLDYGCGDGWLLKALYEQGKIQGGFGVDISPHMLSCCENIFTDIQGFQFFQPDAMEHHIPPHSCDLLLCTETLEHVDDAERAIAQMLPYCKSGAQVVISVPIEIGPSLLIKQMGRYFANLKGRYGYERYRLPELFSAAILWDATRFPSSHLENASLKGHKGFDYRKLEQIVAQKINLEQTQFSPFPVLSNILNSTAIWIGKVP